MAVEHPALFVRTEDGSTAVGHPANILRMFIQSVVGSAGVVGSGDFAVTQSGPSWNVSVADGRAFVAGTEAGDQGFYYCPNVGAATVAVTASDATLDRRDLIVLRVFDADYGDTPGAWQIAYVQGTLSATPVDPTVPANSLTIARIRVGHGTTAVTTAMIDDLRTYASFRGAGLPLALTGATTATRYVGAWSTTGKPLSGTFNAGDFGFDGIGRLWWCSAGGSPGTWQPVPAGLDSHAKMYLHHGGTDLSAYATGAEVPFDTAIFDQNSDLQLPGFFKAPVKGYYDIAYGVLYTNTATGAVQFSLCNGASAELNQGGGSIGYVTSAGQNVWVGASSTVQMNAGDQVGVLYVSAPAGTSTFRADPRFTWLSADYRAPWH
jgi:hypothetical protein